MNKRLRIKSSLLYQLPIRSLIVIVFEYLEFRDFIKLDAISTFFRKNLAEKLIHLKLQDEHGKTFDISSPGHVYTDDMLRYIAKVFPKIQTFTSNVQNKFGDVSASGLIQLMYGCKSIQVVDYSLETLRYSCAYENWTRFSINNAADFKNLQYLGLHNSRNLNDMNMEDICFHVRSLVTLDIGDCQGFTDTGLTWIATCQPGLEHLDIGTCHVKREWEHHNMLGDCNERFSNVGLAALAKGCKKLKSLIIRNNLPLVDRASTEKDLGNCWAGLLSIISNCRGLELLDISMDDPHRAFLGDDDGSEYDKEAWKYIRHMELSVLESILGLPLLRILHLGGISAAPQLNMAQVVLNAHSECLKWVGLQQTQLMSLVLEDNIVVTSCFRRCQVSGELIAQWKYKAKTAFQVFHDVEVSDLRICYGFHNYQRNKEKRWLQLSLIHI